MTRSVYIVDDNSGGRALLHCLLAVRSGQIVRSFRDGDEFLKHAPALAPGVLLLDFERGMDVLENIREADQKNYAPIFLIGEGSLELAVQAMKAGALDLVEKPFEARQLLSAVDAAFSRLARNGLADARIQRARARRSRAFHHANARSCQVSSKVAPVTSLPKRWMSVREP